MKTLKKRLNYMIFCVLITVVLTACADSKNFIIDGEKVTIEPYGCFDLNAKHDSIEYKINAGNIVLDIIFCETIIVPVILIGDQLYEPIRKK